jgi:ubiquinone/menaquinone biosynthesis C-methylase UbiE
MLEAETQASEAQPDSIEESWDRIKDVFDGWADEGAGDAMEEAHHHLGHAIAQELPAGEKDTVLDLSCGSGWFARHLASEFLPNGHLIGIDLSPKMIEAAKESNSDLSNVRFEVARAEKLPLDDASVDHVVSVESFYYYPNQVTAGHEMFRVLKPGGTFFVAMNYYLENRFAHRWADLIDAVMHCKGADQYNTLFRACGFIDVGDQRIRDESPEPEKADGKWFKTLDQLRGFREEGSMLISGRKPPEED